MDLYQVNFLIGAIVLLVGLSYLLYRCIKGDSDD